MRLLPPTLRNAGPRVLLAAVLPAVAAATARGQAAPVANPADVAADAALADRIETLASLTFPPQVPTGADRPFVFAQQAALFQAAATLDPSAVRYARKRAEALSDGGADVDEQYKALTAILAIQPSDEFTWNRLLDLHVDQMQVADKQIDYLRQIETNPNLPRDVVAHAGARHAQILYDQGKEQAARTLLGSVLTSNPLDLDALRLRYRLLPVKATPTEREQALLNILRANPLQPQYARLAALVAADAGLVQDAISFFSLGVNTSFAQRRPDLEGALDWAAELYVANQNVDAYRLTQSLLSSSPNYAAAWYLRLLVVRSSGFAQADQDKDLQTATVVFSNRLAELVNATADAAGHQGAATQPRATTRPFDFEGGFPLPDVAASVAILKGSAVSPQLRQEFIDAAADLARLEIYFAHKPDAAAPLLDALGQLLPANDPLLAQLRGLSSLVAGDTKNALATLAGVAKTDPIAAMGLIQAQLKENPKDTQQADMEARKLIQDHPDGLIGAFLLEGLSNPRVRLVPPNGNQLLQELLQAFPRDLFSLAAQPGRLYSIHVEPVEVGRTWGQPLLTRITLFNFSSTDLTIGQTGAIHPGLLFQMAPLLNANQPTAYPAFDTLAGPVVLHPRMPLTQIVRVDQSALIGVLDRTVGVAFQVDGQAATNADSGVGGFAVHFDKPFARTAVNAQAVATAQNDLNGAGVGGSSPAQRLTAVGVLQAYVRETRKARGQPPAVVANVADVANAVHRARNDPSPAVKAWAAQADFALNDAPGRATILNDLLVSPDWRQRLMAVILVRVVPDVALQHKVIDGLKADRQPAVQAYAKATAELLKQGKLNPPPPPPPAAPPVPSP